MNKILSLLFIGLFPFVLFAQERPKIGLALSGGGAKSMTHIGVIRELEKRNIRPDYITGTSMGAIIGAMYATGFSADEIEQMLLEVDWQALLDNSIPRTRLSYLDRTSDDRYMASLKIDTNGIDLPDALNSGQYVLSTLTYLFSSVHDSTDFSKFNIPFSCVATDLETGEEVIYNEGDLGHVLRASSAFPSIFSPFEIDGKLLVDGGVRNNLPISLLREKGMDIIIASDVQSGLHTRSELNNAINILEQVGSFPNMEKYEEEIEEIDLMIKPNVEEFTIVSYDNAREIIRRGAEETIKYDSILSQWSVDSLPDRTPPLPPKEVQFDAIIVHGTKATSPDFVRSTVGIHPNKLAKMSALQSGMERLYGSRFYHNVDYRILHTPDGKALLHIYVDEIENNAQARIGLHYDDDYNIGLLLNLTVRNAILKNSKFALDVVISENPRGEMSYIFERGFIPALGFKTEFHQFNSRLYQNNNPISEYTFTQFGTEVFVHSTLWNLYTIGGGVKLENFDISEPILRGEIKESNTSYLNYFAFVDFDSFDRSYKPRKGFVLNGEFQIISEQENYRTYSEPVSILHLKYDLAIQMTKKWGGRFRWIGATTVGPDAPFPYSIFLGGMGENYSQHVFPFIGYRYMELFGRNAASLRGDLWYEFAPNQYISAIANVGKVEATINDLYSSNVLLDGYAISYGYNSPIGPVEFYVSKSTNHSNVYTYLRIGLWF